MNSSVAFDTGSSIDTIGTFPAMIGSHLSQHVVLPQVGMPPGTQEFAETREPN